MRDIAAFVNAQKTIDLLGNLISINSVNSTLVPGARGEEELAHFLADYCRDLGLQVRLQEVAPDRPNVIAILRGKDPSRGRSLILNGHTDTVDIAGMTIDPLFPRIEAGRVYGRGAVDMKGGLASIIGAVNALVDSGVELLGDVIIAAVVDEEYASIGTEGLVKEYRADAAIVAEPTDLQIHTCHRGFAWARIETHGKAAHGSRPAEGIDAITKMGKVLAELDRLQNEILPRLRHPVLGAPSVHASLINGGRELSTYPDLCSLQLERRTIPGETPDDVKRELQNLCDSLAARDPQFKAAVEVFFARPPYEISVDAPIVRSLHEACTKVSGVRPVYGGMSAWMDSAVLWEAGIPAVIFGPGGQGLHAAVEFVSRDQVIAAAHILAETAVDFCGTDD